LLRWADDLDIGLGLGSGPATDGSIPADDGQQSNTGDGSAVTDHELMHSLSIKTISTVEGLAMAQLASPAQIEAVVVRLAADGLVRAGAGAVRLTEKGRDEADALMRADRAGLGEENANAALDHFLGLDSRMKQAVTAWQLREVAGEPVVNEHDDADYDAAVLGRLQALYAETAPWLDSLARQLPRIAAYTARLGRASRAVERGDGRFVSSPRVDSLHSVWFELHEYLIQLAGRTREEETAAGRA
jgi:pyruvate,orthophosphate dikinase